jgi:hypothetical protein
MKDKIALNVPTIAEIKTRIVIPNAARWATKTRTSKKVYNRLKDRRVDQ